MANFKADPTAQHLWHEGADASNLVASFVTSIPAATVRGEQTRDELQQANTLFVQAAALLVRTSQREEARYKEGEQ